MNGGIVRKNFNSALYYYVVRKPSITKNKTPSVLGTNSLVKQKHGEPSDMQEVKVEVLNHEAQSF